MSQQRQNSQYHRVMQNKYKIKRDKLKRQIKNLVFENGALCDEVAQLQADVFAAREERRYLVKRLLNHEAALEHLEEDQQDDTVTDATNAATSVPKKRGPKKKAQTQTEKPSEKTRTKAHDKIVLDANGKPMFPIILNNVLIHSIGQILPLNPSFQALNYIYPVGYLATRVYVHPKEIQRKCVYTCKILNNAGKPQFQLIPDNDLDSVFFGDSASVCHQFLLESIKNSLGDSASKVVLRVQGEKFFGLTETTVKSLLQMDPGFKQCTIFKGFDQPETHDGLATDDDKDPAICADVLQAISSKSVSFRVMPEVKDEPPDELLDIIDYCSKQ